MSLTASPGRSMPNRPKSLERLVQAGHDRPTEPEAATPLLDRVIAVLVEAGWSPHAAARAVTAIAAHARTDGYRFGLSAGWRRLAPALDLPAWRVRRVTLLIVGAPGWPGLVERLALEGDAALERERHASGHPSHGVRSPAHAGEARRLVRLR